MGPIRPDDPLLVRIQNIKIFTCTGLIFPFMRNLLASTERGFISNICENVARHLQLEYKLLVWLNRKEYTLYQHEFVLKNGIVRLGFCAVKFIELVTVFLRAQSTVPVVLVCNVSDQCVECTYSKARCVELVCRSESFFYFLVWIAKINRYASLNISSSF